MAGPPLVDEPPERDPFVDLLFRDEAGLFLAALVAFLGLLVLLRWLVRRRGRADPEE